MDTNKVDVRVDINRDKAALLGIPLDSIDHSIRTALVGTPLGLYRDELGDEYQITLRLSEYIEPKLATFDDIMLPTPKGQLVPLLQVAQIIPETSLARFQHYSTERMASVLADVAPGYVTAQVAKALKQELDGTTFPEGISIRFGGEEAGREEAFGGMGMATIVAVLAIMAVLVLQFKSLAQPLIIFTAIPFAAIGSSLALLLTGNTFSFAAFVGITSLVGIVVNNSIILVDYANQMRSEGKNVQEAIAAAAHTAFYSDIADHSHHHSGLSAAYVVGFEHVGALVLGDNRRADGFHHHDFDGRACALSDVHQRKLILSGNKNGRTRRPFLCGKRGLVEHACADSAFDFFGFFQCQAR